MASGVVWVNCRRRSGEHAMISQEMRFSANLGGFDGSFVDEIWSLVEIRKV